MAELKESAVSLADAVTDLEDPLQKARAAAKVLEMVLDAIMQSKHPTPTSRDLLALLLHKDECEAADYAMAEVLDALQGVYAAWEVIHEMTRPNAAQR